MLLVYRCYIVWGYNKRILISSSFFLVALTVSGYVLEGSPSMPLAEHSWVYLLMTFVLNVILTVLTGKLDMSRLYKMFDFFNCRL